MALTSAERHRLRQSRYRRSAKGKATQARYRTTPTGQLITSNANARRIRFGGMYRGHAVTVALASVIRSHITEKTREFEQRQQARAEAESLATGTVPTQASDGADRLGRRHPSS